MIRTLNREKGKQLKTNTRMVVTTTLFLVLLGAAMLFLALAGHV